MTRHPSSFQPQAHLIDALHHQALETSAVVASLFLLIQVSFGSAELLRIQEQAYAALEADHAVS